MTHVKIGLDSRTVYAKNPRGTGQCLIRLFRHLAPLEPSWSFYLYTYPSSITPDLPKANILKKEIDIKGLRWNLWEQFRLPWAAFYDRANLLHCPAQTSPYFTSCPKVVTIHDLIPLKMANASPRITRIFMRNLTRSLRTAKKIITVSEYSKRDILETFPFVKPKDIVVISWPPLHDFLSVSRPQSLEEIKVRYSLNKPYIFAYGAAGVRKNTMGLLKSFALFVKNKNYDIQLLIGGLRGHEKAPFIALADELNIQKNITFADYIPDNDIPYIMSGAVFFVFITLYEGFGLPLVDAMACEVPILASNLTSIPEVVGDAGMLVNPRNHQEVADVMETLFNDCALRKNLIEKGKLQLKRFSWDNTARTVLNVYKEILQK